MIEIRNLVKKYGDLTVLDGVNATINQGEIISVIGPSGTGKSTLLRCMNVLETPDGGEIFIDGENILDPKKDTARLRQRMGMVFQSFNLFNHLTVLDNLTLGPIKLLKKKRSEAEKRGFELLSIVGLADKAGNLPNELSGGQKQRVAIARCLSMDPEIILFDEPTSALDPATVSEVLAVIRRLAREGMTMVIVTHEMNFAQNVSSRVFYIDEGIIYEYGPPEQIFHHPLKEKTRRFIQKIRTWEYQIVSKNFDFYGMNGEIERFCEKHFFSRKMTNNTLLVIEECVNLYFLLPDRAPLSLILSYVEKKDEVHILFEDRSLEGNFLELARTEDSLEQTLIQGMTRSIHWERTADFNRLSMILKN